MGGLTHTGWFKAVHVRHRHPYADHAEQSPKCSSAPEASKSATLGCSAVLGAPDQLGKLRSIRPTGCLHTNNSALQGDCRAASCLLSHPRTLVGMHSICMRGSPVCQAAVVLHTLVPGPDQLIFVITLTPICKPLGCPPWSRGFLMRALLGSLAGRISIGLYCMPLVICTARLHILLG